MVFLGIGVGHGSAVGVGVDEQDLTAGGGRLEARVMEAVVPAAS
jgi:hypothetical protein